MATFECDWRVPRDHPAFAGHFPNQSIVPGVVLLDRAILFAQNFADHQPRSIYQVTQAKFLSPSGPDDDLLFCFESGEQAEMSFTVQCGGRTIASGKLQLI